MDNCCFFVCVLEICVGFFVVLFLKAVGHNRLHHLCVFCFIQPNLFYCFLINHINIVFKNANIVMAGKSRRTQGQLESPSCPRVQVAWHLD